MILRHTTHTSHKETWELTDPTKVEVESHCPGNYPAHSRHTMDPLDAMRQFILMTTCEGWVVTEGNEDWHQFVEHLAVSPNDVEGCLRRINSAVNVIDTTVDRLYDTPCCLDIDDTKMWEDIAVIQAMNQGAKRSVEFLLEGFNEQ